jgi:hypothetical protein
MALDNQRGAVHQFKRVKLGVSGLNVLIFTTSGAPVDGTSGTGAGLAGIGSLVVRTDTGVWHTNKGTKASPSWKAITSA